jgi:hypothetical protein
MPETIAGMHTTDVSPWRACVAPMMDWTVS